MSVNATLQIDLADPLAVAEASLIFAKLHGVDYNPRPDHATVLIGPADPATEQPTNIVAPRKPRKPRAVVEPTAQTAPVEATPAPASSAAFDDDDAPPPSSFLEEDEPVKVATKDDVRAALVGLQLKRHGQFVAKGQDEKTAAANAEAAAKAVLVSVGGSERLGTLDASKYGAVVEAANKEAAK